MSSILQQVIKNLSFNLGFTHYSNSTTYQIKSWKQQCIKQPTYTEVYLLIPCACFSKTDKRCCRNNAVMCQPKTSIDYLISIFQSEIYKLHRQNHPQNHVIKPSKQPVQYTYLSCLFLKNQKQNNVMEINVEMCQSTSFFDRLSHAVLWQVTKYLYFNQGFTHYIIRQHQLQKSQKL